MSEAQEDPGREAWSLLFRLFRTQRREMQAAHADLQLNPGQVHLLMNLAPDQTIAMSELAEALACDASYITGIVDRLEARNLVHRLPAAEDRRVKLVGLTATGRELHATLLQRVTRPPPFIETMPPEDKQALRDIFMRAVQRLHDAPAPEGDSPGRSGLHRKA